MTEKQGADDRQHVLSALATAVEAAIDPLTRLRALTALVNLAREVEGQAVAEARASRHSWTVIGAALSVTKQSAARRFADAPARPTPGLETFTSEMAPTGRRGTFEGEVTTRGGRILFIFRMRRRA
jgi:hypothetical protein